MRLQLLSVVAAIFFCTPLAAADTKLGDAPVDYNRDIRALLSNHCFRCHGPDDAERKGDLRLDISEDAKADRGGYRAIEPGKPDESEVLSRITSEDSEERMPPDGSGRRLNAKEVELLRRWIADGAKFAKHWAYEKPERPVLPQVENKSWPKTPVDYFVLARLEQAGLGPAPVADRSTLIRRLSLDLTGLPPTLEEVNRFVQDKSDTAYEDLVDRLLEKTAYGERWAAMWLDLARYADSAGYANDPPRTIWLYRDWVIKALNNNMPFDEFTIRQLAGDLLPEPDDDSRIATAFHRNTLTNSEGGTNDEEFRNVAVVDRVNTTLEVWMGATIRCAQCHNHKYDPITQDEYFRLFAFFNNTEDSDRADETPLLSVWTDGTKRRRDELQGQVDALKSQLTPTPEKMRELALEWAAKLQRPATQWRVLEPREATATGDAKLTVRTDGSVLAEGPSPASSTYKVRFHGPLEKLTALRIEALPDDSLPGNGPGRSSHGNFVLNELRVQAGPHAEQLRRGRFVRLELPGKAKMLHVAEVQVFSGGENVAVQGKATQVSTGFDGPARLAIDGDTNGDYAGKSVSHTAIQDNPWWEVDLGGVKDVERIVVWNRTDNNLQSRLDGFVLSLLDADRKLVWRKAFPKAPSKNLASSLTGLSQVILENGTASFEQREGKDAARAFTAAAAIDAGAKGTKLGWAIGPRFGLPHTAVFELRSSVDFAAGVLELELEQTFGESHTLGCFRVSATSDAKPIRQLPLDVEQALATSKGQWTDKQQQTVVDYFRTVVYRSPKTLTDKIAALGKQMAGLKPVTVPVLRELTEGKRRKTFVQVRGNYLMTTNEVNEGTPAAFHPFPKELPKNRLGFARWLVHEENPLTARVVVNRYWEQLFGAGLVVTSEDFGVQGDLPSHPLLLDWLATELMANEWNLKQTLRSIVTSATYRQASAVSEELQEKDPFNRLLARGPRFRLSAEMVRDQALAASGLLSRRMHGPSVRPPRPKLGLKAAFGGSTDWETSPGEDRFRRGLYTSWRRSLPYPSMATFDAPSRNVCTIRRGRTNTPLQALVTLNDPVYVEAAQALARRMIAEAGDDNRQRADLGLRLCLARPASQREQDRLVALFEEAKRRYAKQPEFAKQLATEPIGPAPENVDVVDLAAWTVVANVLLNLDETLSKR